MSIIVTVRIRNVTMDRVREVAAERPDLGLRLKGLLEGHGCISHRRLVGENEIMDIDEWESEEGFRAFLAEAQPVIDELARLRGSDAPVDSVWIAA